MSQIPTGLRAESGRLAVIGLSTKAPVGRGWSRPPEVRFIPGRAVRVVRLVALLLAMTRSCRAEDPPHLEFTRLVAHWDGYGTPDYLKFIEEARPDIAQVGFHGAHFWSLGHTPQYKDYPAHFPVRGLDELGAWLGRLNGELHERGVKEVGHFNVEFRSWPYRKDEL